MPLMGTAWRRIQPPPSLLTSGESRQPLSAPAGGPESGQQRPFQRQALWGLPHSSDGKESVCNVGD